MADTGYDRALALYVAGRRGEAEAALGDVLRRDPSHAEAWHLRGVLAIDAGDPGAAVGHLREALHLKPDYAEAHMNLGNALVDLGQVVEGLAALRAAIRLAPSLAMAHNSLGVAFQRLGQWQAAAMSYRRAIDHKADYPEAWTNLGNSYRELGRGEDSIAAHRQALALRPDDAQASVNLATALRSAGRLEEAVAAYRAALARDPALDGAAVELGATLRAVGRLHEALTVLEPARAAGADYNLGVVLSDLGRFAEAREALEHAVALDPGFAPAHYASGNVLRDLGDIDAALAAYRRAVDRNPAFDEAWSNLLFLLNARSGETDESLVRANRAWAATLPPPAAATLPNDPTPERRLRIGYLSSEFRRHHFLAEFLPVLETHDRNAFLVTCYADVASPDGDTERVAGLADGFRNLHGLPMREQADAIRADAIDILISLTGYLARDRRLLATRVAPLQVTYINHLTTTGLATVDCRISDEWLDPAKAVPPDDPETAVRLPSGFSVFAPPPDAPPPGPPPCLAHGPVTFGCFNNLIKLTDETLALWARILDRAASARLVVKARDLSHEEVRAAFARRLDRAGIRRERCELVGLVPDSREHLLHYQRVDIGLDPVPFAGGATTREMLWMGVPVITLEGQTRAARLGGSILRRAGLAELVAGSPEDYVTKAIALAEDKVRLAELRAGQRERLRKSPLLDATRHTRELEAAYRRMWREWCGRRAATA